jgi:hypothetical protein
LQLRKDGCFPVRSEVHLLATNLAVHQARCRQQFQLALHGADSAADLPRELSEVVRFVGVAEKPAEYTPPGATKEDDGRIKRRWGCSQDGDNVSERETQGQPFR